MKQLALRALAAVLLPGLLLTVAPQAARANGTSTALWAAAAATIIGTIYYDSSHRPYWRDHSGHTHYVSAQTANYYNQHHWNNVAPTQRKWQDQKGSWHHGCCG